VVVFNIGANVRFSITESEKTIKSLIQTTLAQPMSCCIINPAPLGRMSWIFGLGQKNFKRDILGD